MKKMACMMLMMLLTACATSFEKIPIKSEQITVSGINIVSNHPDIINTYVQPIDNQTVICLEPDPDFTSTFNGSFSLGANVGTNSSTIGDSKGQSAVTAGGLSPMVLIARELLYRACELSMNTNATAEQQIAIYQTFLKTIETISTSNLGTGTQATQPNQTNSPQQ